MKYSSLLIAMLALLFFACSDNEGSSSLRVMLTDNPSDAKEVNVEILQVSAQISSGDESGWHDLSTNAGIYDLLILRDSMAFLADDNDLPAGRLNQVRLLLGDNNTIVFEEDTFDMFVPSGMQSGIKINVNQDLQDGENYEILLDFDAEESVVHTGDDSYQLKPVIKVEDWKRN